MHRRATRGMVKLWRGVYLRLLRQWRLLGRALAVLRHVVLLRERRGLRRALPHVRWRISMAGVLLHTGEHAAAHALGHADARWSAVHLLWAERSVLLLLLSHGRRNHVVGRQRRGTVGLRTHGLA